MVTVRAVYRDGQFQPLDEVDFQEGQEVPLRIVERPSSIRDLIGDMLVHFDHDTYDLDEAAIMQGLDEALAGKRHLSEIIIEER